MSRVGTVNATGIRYLAIGKPDEQGRLYATRWFVFFQLPIFPLTRDLIRPLSNPVDGGNFQYELFSEGPPRLSEVLRTYLFGWILFPCLLLGPLAFAILVALPATGVAEGVFGFLGMNKDWIETVRGSLIVVGLIWLIAAAIVLSHWHDARFTSKQ